MHAPASFAGKRFDLADARRYDWIGFDPPAEPFRAEVQVRYRHEPAPALVALDGRLAEIRFDRPEVAVAPGEGFGSRGRGWARLSLAVTDDVLDTGLERLARLL